MPHSRSLEQLGRRIRSKWIGAISSLLLTFLLVGCSTDTTPNMLDAQGSAAAEINSLWWLMFWLALLVFVAVITLTTMAIYRSRQRKTAAPNHYSARPTFFLTAGAIIPLFILIPLIIVSVRASRTITLPGAQSMMTIDVIGRQWWWEVRYPDHGIVTANEIHIPAGERVAFRITSQDVIHSFWVPQLHGKLDMNPGRVNVIHLEAAEPGEYMGLCAEFCGLQHTFMLFWVIAHPPESFAEWIAQRQQAAVAPTDALQARGQEVYFAAACDQCHVIEGITRLESQIGAVGPDLTHYASRGTLGAGRAENNAETLAAFIINPHAIKPGVHMPPTPLSTDDLEALVAFLMNLE
ncbi:MAG: cytochrome c oxidase subunit II [Caldilineaceae bacterium]|nr:cytochrome c oxidase subunit II [Caldilineaceae bacterium]